MPSALVVSIGSVTANSYATRAEADAYAGDRLHSAAWTAAAADDKDRALLWATKILDTRVKWAGIISDYRQALAWPRSDVSSLNSGQYFLSTEIPPFVKQAQIELAIALLTEDRTLDPGSAGISSLSVPGAVSLTFDKTGQPPVLPQQVRDLIAPYGSFDSGGSMRVLPIART